MKNKKRLLSLASAALALLLLLGTLPACGGKANETDTIGSRALAFDKVYKSLEESRRRDGYETAEEIAILKGKTVTVYGELLRFTENQKYCFYSVEEDRVVLEIPTSEVAVGGITADEGYLCVVTTEGGKQKTAVYGMNGKQYAEVDGHATIDAENYGFVLGDCYYRVEDGECHGVFEIPPFVNQGEMGFTENYYYLAAGNTVTLYDEEKNAVVSYTFPAGSVSRYRMPLSGDRMLLEYRERCPEESTDYDFIEGDQKYTVHHVLLNGKTGKTRELDLGTSVCMVYRPDSVLEGREVKDIFTDRVSDILVYYTVVNGFLTSHRRYAILEENGKVGAMLDEYVDGQTGLILPLNGTQFYTQTDYGYAILDAEGEELLRAPHIGTVKDYGYYDSRNYSEARLYDKDFKLALVVHDSNTNIIRNTFTSLVYKKIENGETVYCVYDKDGNRTLSDKEGLVLYNLHSLTSTTGCFIAVYAERDSYGYNEAYHYELRRHNGEVLYEMEKTTRSYYERDICEPLVTGEGTAVIQDTVDQQTVYIRLSE